MDQLTNSEVGSAINLSQQAVGTDEELFCADLLSRPQTAPDTQVVIITAFGTVQTAVDAIKLGASDYITKPLVFDDILIKLERLLDLHRLADENRFLLSELENRYSFEGIIGSSKALQDVLELVRKLANTTTSALITGESGTGKELIARAIHYHGVTRNGRFMAINCAALPETLVESELFGHKRGAFTNASTDKVGLFKVAENGTIFLDEISSMSLAVQAKLLRAIEEKAVLPVGGTEPVQINARILCATNRDLAHEVEAQRFRIGLFYRLNVVEIHIPPLRQRCEDIPQLVEYFVAKYSQELKKPSPGVSGEAVQAMVAYNWPGNVRELENVIERAIIFAENRLIGLEDLAFVGRNGSGFETSQAELKPALQAFERKHILQVLQGNGFDKLATAKALNIGLSSLYRKMDELGIPVRAGNNGGDQGANVPGGSSVTPAGAPVGSKP